MKFESVLSQPFATLEAFDKLVVTAFYLTLVLAVLFAVSALLVKKLKAEKLSSLYKAEKYFTVGYAVSFGIMMVVLKMSEIIAEDEFFKELFWPIASILIVGVALAAVGGILSLIKPQYLPKFKFIAFVTVLIPIIVSIVMLAKYYKTVEDYYTGVSQVGLYVSAAILVIILIGGALFFGKKNTGGLNTREMAYAAISIALAFALSYIRFFKLPQGGSITLASMLPIMLFSYMFGIKKGVLVGVIYGLLQAIQDPWIIHPAQFLLDYPVAFGMIGFAGLFHELDFFKNKPVIAFSLGAVTAVFLRYICHVMSGIFAFSSYAQAGYSAVAWGFLYNAFVFADLVIALIVGIMLLSSKNFLRVVENKADVNGDNGENASGSNSTETQEKLAVINNNAEADGHGEKVETK